MQTRTMSLIEVCLNIGSGYLIALATASIVFPLFGLEASLSDNLAIVAIFTVVSIVRSYAWRRVFNAVWKRQWLQ